jgi:hypothetical protein
VAVAILLNNTRLVDREVKIGSAREASVLIPDLSLALSRDYPVDRVAMSRNQMGEEVAEDLAPPDFQGKVIFVENTMPTGGVSTAQATALRQNEVERTVYIGNIPQQVFLSNICCFDLQLIFDRCRLQRRCSWTT